MKYKLGNYICNGWGGYGIYEVTDIIRKDDIYGVDIIKFPLIGNSGGYEDFEINEEFAKRIVDVFNTLDEDMDSSREEDEYLSWSEDPGLY